MAVQAMNAAIASSHVGHRVYLSAVARTLRATAYDYANTDIMTADTIRRF